MRPAAMGRSARASELLYLVHLESLEGGKGGDAVQFLDKAESFVESLCFLSWAMANSAGDTLLMLVQV